MSKRFLSLEEVKEIELSILEKFASYCDDNGLKYALTYGTLIGAVRHHGFIPWDDDIDVMMPRKDYEIFVKAFSKVSPIKECEFLNRYNAKNYYYPFGKLCDSTTIAKMDDNNTVHGIWIDIFPVDFVPDSEKKAKAFHRKLRFLKNLVISYTTDFSSKALNWKIIPKYIYKAIARIIGIENVLNRIEILSQKYNSKTNKISIMCWQTSGGGNMKRFDIEHAVELEFEGKRFKCPLNYDTYLKSIYGSYMDLPSENKRTTHHLNAYYR